MTSTEWTGDHAWSIVAQYLDDALLDAMEQAVRVISDLREPHVERYRRTTTEQLRERIVRGSYAHGFDLWKRPGAIGRYSCEREMVEEVLDLVAYCAIRRWMLDVDAGKASPTPVALP